MAALAGWSNFDRGRGAAWAIQAAVGIPEAWFLGPKAENDQLLSDLVGRALRQHVDFRRSFHPEDPTHITKAVQSSVAYRDADRFTARQCRSAVYPAPPICPAGQHAPPRPYVVGSGDPWALIGYFGAMLYNQNNVARRSVAGHHLAGNRGRAGLVPHVGHAGGGCHVGW